MIDLFFDLKLVQGDFALEIRESSRVEVLGLFGPSGSGKTTLLETIAGLRTPARGAIKIGGATLFDSAHGVDLPPRDRHIGYVPQDVLLFPHLDVRSNLLYGAGAAEARRGSAEARTRGSSEAAKAGLRPLADILDIGPLLNRRVNNLSGGERQRVAIGRALMTNPALMLLDEPFAAVDRARREQILPYLLRLRRELHVPLVYVTHDAHELSQIADRVMVIDNGRVVTAGPPYAINAADAPTHRSPLL
jgi:molybdate transport system ATP-binding protein